jgi:hypothetical protein
MPLTNYLMQSVIATTLFYGYAFGLYYRIGPGVGVLIAFAIYAVQMAYSAWWMARFRFGPMEWLWRTLTYGKAPGMLAPAAPPLAGTPGGELVSDQDHRPQWGHNDFETARGDVSDTAPLNGDPAISVRQETLNSIT